MKHETKMMLVNALIKVVENAPKQDVTQGVIYNPNINKSMFNVTQNQFDAWIKYVFEVLKIVSQYVDIGQCLTEMQNIMEKKEMSNFTKTNNISQVLLSFARKILCLYEVILCPPSLPNPPLNRPS